MYASIQKYLFPDGCGTRERGVGCYVPVLTRCPSVPLHRSEKRHANYSRGKLIAIYGGYTEPSILHLCMCNTPFIKRYCLKVQFLNVEGIAVCNGDNGNFCNAVFFVDGKFFL